MRVASVTHACRIDPAYTDLSTTPTGIGMSLDLLPTTEVLRDRLADNQRERALLRTLLGLRLRIEGAMSEQAQSPVRRGPAGPDRLAQQAQGGTI